RPRGHDGGHAGRSGCGGRRGDAGRRRAGTGRGRAGPVMTAARITGVDVARGTALLGMMAVHSFDVLDEGGAPTTATIVAAGRSAAAFVVIAGISLAFMSGGRQVVRGQERVAVSAGLVVRALM